MGCLYLSLEWVSSLAFCASISLGNRDIPSAKVFGTPGIRFVVWFHPPASSRRPSTLIYVSTPFCLSPLRFDTPTLGSHVVISHQDRVPCRIRPVSYQFEHDPRCHNHSQLLYQVDCDGTGLLKIGFRFLFCRLFYRQVVSLTNLLLNTETSHRLETRVRQIVPFGGSFHRRVTGRVKRLFF